MRVSVTGASARGLVLISALLLSTAAFAAPNATKIANSMVAALQAKGETKATFESATTAGDDVTITNLKIVSKSGSDVVVPSVVIANPIERTPGGFSASSIAFDAGTAVDGDQTVTWTKGLTNDSIIPDPTEMHSSAKLTPFSHFEISGIRVANKGKPDPVTVDSVTLELGNVVDGSPNEGKLTVAGVNIPGSTMGADEQAKIMLDQLGYTSVSFDLTVDSGFDAAKDQLAIRAITVDAKDMGKLTITGTFGGLPRAKLQNADQLKELGATATVEAATIRFDDAGITNKVLDMQAKQMGATRDSLAMMLPAALPMAFSQLNINDAAFQQQVVDAVTAFLKDPKSLTIKLAPTTPVLLRDIGAAAMSAPASVPTLLAVGVQANN